MESSSPLSFYGYSVAYFDTNVYGTLVQQPDSWRPISDYLLENNLLLGVSDVNVLELSSAPGLHRDLARFLLRVPSALFKPASRIMAEEVEGYLNGEEVNPLLGPIASLPLESDHPVGYLEAFLRREVVTTTRSVMEQRKEEFEKRILETLENFDPVVGDNYTEADGPYYAFQLIWLQILCQDHPRCAARIRDEMGSGWQPHLPSVAPQFRGLWLFALAQFYRYYLHRRKPAGNDYGDLIQAVSVPYCSVAILERGLSEDLSHIKGNDPVLRHTAVHDLGFLRELIGLPLFRNHSA
ncbi:MAG TPA: hypothetical protein ENI39_03565 [Anaerolineae bacterium]|nr:hypothetical protein [Anaerolineae bacterium]